ncbi:MAG: type II secretion system major pseudopilin GspG [Gammaproteobacteria bacterium]|nr:type II secretion system major pseudopilin GspG [Gammaproteobacteria bacterium]
MSPTKTIRRTRARGFTLIEILVVLVILGILVGLLAPRVMDRPDQARVVAAKNNVNVVINALKMYRLDNGGYPTSEQGLTALVRRPETGDVPRNWKSGGYLDNAAQLKDPWNNDYLYENVGGSIQVISLGADGQPGGEGYNADVSSENAQ